MKILFKNTPVLPQRVLSAVYIILGITVVLFGPWFLGGGHRSESSTIFSMRSYLTAASIVVTALFLSIFGHTFLSYLGIKKYYRTGIFTSIFVGQAFLAVYFLIRSALNEYVYYLPVGLFEVFLLAACCAFFLIVRTKTSVYECFRHYVVTIDLLHLALFYLVFVGICEYEVPRLVMLSSDPDQHAFFARQIERFGTIPFTQFDWGSLPFMYPSGSGILGWEWGVVSGLDARDAITLLPTLQFFLGGFIILESFSVVSKCVARQLYMAIGACLLMVYVFPYAMDNGHFHQEGTGRLMSISFYAWLIMLLSWVPTTRFQQLPSIRLPIGLVIVIGFVGVVAILLNPVNAFFFYAISSIAFILIFRGNIKIQILVGLIPVISVIFLLDPYYSNMFFSSVSIDASKNLVGSSSTGGISQFVANYWHNFTGVQYYGFFKFEYLPGKYSFVIILLIAGGIALLVGERVTRGLKLLSLALLSGLLVYVVLTPLFSSLPVTGPVRLIAPYFIYSTFQYLFVIVLFLFIFLFSSIYNNNWSARKNYFILTVFMVAMTLITKQSSILNRTERVGYCGSLGCATENDLRVVEYMELYFKDKKQSQSNREYHVEKILLPNMVLKIGGEEWLFPTGGSRMLPFYELPPMAFFYFQGDNAFSFDNYNEHICESFDIEWLEEKNVKYMFVPEQLLDSCVAGLEKIIATNMLIFSSGESLFLEFQDVGTSSGT